MQEHTGLVLRLIVIADYGNRVLAHRVADAIDPCDQDEPGDPLSLNGQPGPLHRCEAYARMLEQLANIPPRLRRSQCFSPSPTMLAGATSGTRSSSASRSANTRAPF